MHHILRGVLQMTIRFFFLNIEFCNISAISHLIYQSHFVYLYSKWQNLFICIINSYTFQTCVLKIMTLFNLILRHQNHTGDTYHISNWRTFNHGLCLIFKNNFEDMPLIITALDILIEHLEWNILLICSCENKELGIFLLRKVFPACTGMKR